MHERSIDIAGPPAGHGLAFTLAAIVGGFIAGLVLPIVLFMVLVGIPFVVFPVAGLVNVLGLPEPIGLILWYVALGAIGGILSGSAKWAYAVGMLVFFGAFGATLTVWPWVIGGLLAWIALDLLARMTDERTTDD